MIKSAKAFFLKGNKLSDKLAYVSFQMYFGESSWDFSIYFSKDIVLSEVYLELELSFPVAYCRSSAYHWIQPDANPWIANSYSPKILKGENGFSLVAKRNSGCWEYNPQNQKLRWYFVHPDLSPMMVFDGQDRRQFLKEQTVWSGTSFSNSILWTKGEVEEWARSPIGFVPIVCFTDHCDFDQTANLKIQREFFEKLGIRITKGFFFYDYSHKEENASFENQASRAELINWEKDGHELVYHSLSQSYRGTKSEQEFENFSSPPDLKPITCYIDHGFHPYNFTKQPLGNWQAWYSHLDKKGVKLFWNYLDSGEGNLLAVNQLNPSAFTLRGILKSAKFFKKLGGKRNRYSVLRDVLMFGVPEEVLWTSKYLKGSLQGLKSKLSLAQLTEVLKNGSKFFSHLISSGFIMSYSDRLDQIFPLSRFSPVFFKASNQSETELWAFQTLFVRDFDVIFSKEALERMDKEKSLMIAHTYFSYAEEGHEGRLFKDQSWEFRKEAADSFERLGREIQEKRIWNPTLTEMKSYFDHFDKLEYRLEGDRLVVDNFKGIKRIIV